ncbi:hypothetical protein [Actinomadura nitritigenes]|uniref:glycoside hydrolase family 78 protein n=1 Tax=Actinomadura nitritigenes TaxID=134602 RepID=UPI003D89CD32
MTTLIVYSGSADDSLTSSSTSYATALNGSAVTSSGGGGFLTVGQDKDGSTYRVDQAAFSYAYTADPAKAPVSAFFVWDQAQLTGTGVYRAVEIMAFNWGGALDSADWRTASQLRSLLNDGSMVAKIEAAQATGLGRVRTGLERMSDLDASATLRYILASGRNRNESTPGGAEYHVFRASETAGTAQDPALYVAQATRHLMDVTLGAQVQLSDGTHVYLKSSTTAPDIVDLSVIHHDGTSPSTVYTAPITEHRVGAQNYALVADDRDNLFVLNGNPDTPGVLRCRAFTKGAGHSWAAQPVRNASLPTYYGDVNNVAAAWHPQGVGGTIVALAAHNAGRNSDVQLAYALVNANHLLTGSGDILRGSGNAEGPLVDNPGADGSYNYVNETGTLLDVAAARGSARGYVVCTTKQQVLGAAAAQSCAGYQLNASGTAFASTARLRDTATGWATKDADAKSRVIGIDSSQFVTVTADNRADRGITVVHRQIIGSGGVTQLADVRLDAEDLTALPAPSVLATGALWDAVYNPIDNRVWVYYFDRADGHRLMRTDVNLTTGQASQEENQVATGVGAADSTNHAIRVHRGATAGARVLITVANKSAGGVHTVLAVTDHLNSLPSQPTLTPKANFDATNATNFAWKFNDPDPGDTQTAFQIEIYDTATGTLKHDSAKTASATSAYTLPAATLSNGATYRWRVRVWDSQDEESTWSDFATFATSASGSVTITAPATDNDPTIITADYLITWSVTGTVQAAYRVVVTRTDTGATLIDTNWTTSTATSYLVEEMAAGVEYEVKVTVRNASAVASNTASRLITPDYAAPEKPLVAVEAVDDGGYVLVTVTNPTPQGDRPNPDSNEIYRRRAGTGGAWLLIAEVGPDGTHRDYTVPSGSAFEYMARAGVTS